MPDFRDNNPYQGNEENLSTSLSGFSDSLSKNADQLKRNSTNLKNNADSLDSNTKALLQMAKSFSEDAKKFTSDMKTVIAQTKSATKDRSESQESAISDMSKIFDKSSKNLDGAMTRGQKISSVFLTTLETVGGRIIKEFLGGASRIAESYKSSLNDITVRMQWTQQRYADMYNNASKQFLESGLGQQFSPKDYANALTETVVTGLRGDEAQRQAYHNLITNRLIPAISTNTVAYRRMAKQMGDTFNEGIVAIGKYSESIYGAEGIEEGKLNNMIDALQVSLGYAASTGKYDEKDVQKALDQMAFTANALEDAGIDTDDFTSNIKSILEGNIDSVSDVFHAMGIGTKDKLLERVMNDPASLFKDYAEKMTIGANSSLSATGFSENTFSLGGDTRTAMMIQTAINNGLDWDEIAKDFSKYQTQAELDKWNSYLEKGEGRTNDQKLDAYEENVGTALGVIEAQVPRFNDLVSDVKKILGVLTTALLADTVKGGFGKGGDGLLSKLLEGKSVSALSSGSSSVLNLPLLGSTGNGMVSGSGVLGKLAGYGYSHGAATTATGASAAGSGLASLALGPGALIAGGIMAGVDAGQAGKVASDEGLGAGGVALQSLRGLVTGGQMMTGEEELSATSAALSGQKRSFDWGEVGMNTLKGTAIGAGVGTAVGGWAAGIGTAVGAGVGAIAGAVTNMIDQAIENAKYNELADASTKMVEQFDDLSKAQSDYEKTITKGKENNKKADALYAFATNKTAGATEELERSFKELQTEYPSIIGDLESINELEPQYIDALKAKIEAENKLAQDKVIAEGTEALQSLRDVQKEFDDIAKESVDKDLVSTGARHFLETVTSTGGENGKQYSSSELDQLIKESLEMSPGMTFEDLQAELNAGGGGEVLKVKKDGSYVLAGQKGGGATAGDNMSQRYNEVLKAEGYQKEAIDVLNSSKGQASNVYGAILQIAKNYMDEEGNYTFDEGTKTSLSTMIEEFNSYVKNYNDTASTYKISSMKLSKDTYTDIDKIFSAAGKSPPSFKVGAYNIQKDNMLANLHQGEMVLTSANANMLRNLGSGGIGGLLTGLTALGQAKATSVDEGPSEVSSVGSMIVSAIQSQTESLLNSMSVIIGYVSKISGSKSQGSGESNISKEMLTYEGA